MKSFFLFITSSNPNIPSSPNNIVYTIHSIYFFCFSYAIRLFILFLCSCLLIYINACLSFCFVDISHRINNNEHSVTKACRFGFWKRKSGFCCYYLLYLVHTRHKFGWRYTTFRNFEIWKSSFVTAVNVLLSPRIECVWKINPGCLSSSLVVYSAIRCEKKLLKIERCFAIWDCLAWS